MREEAVSGFEVNIRNLTIDRDKKSNNLALEHNFFRFTAKTIAFLRRCRVKRYTILNTAKPTALLFRCGILPHKAATHSGLKPRNMYASL
jgi:hypothetical protein